MPDTDIDELLHSANDYNDDGTMDEDINPAAAAHRPFMGPLPSSIPKVIDQTAESVRNSFERFLEGPDDLMRHNSYSSFLPVTVSPLLTRSFTEEQNPNGLSQPYLAQIYQLKQEETLTVYVDHTQLQSYDEPLAKAIAEQYYRFMPYLRRAVQNLVRNHIPTYLYTNSASTSEQRGGQVPREFAVAFYGLPAVHGIRELRTEKIGQLISISGTVTRTSEVRPELVYGSFTCVECGMVVKEVEQQFKYTEPMMCQNPTCQNRLMWDLSIEQSRFVDWQRVRIQENSNEIPTGSMPRSMDVILRNEIVERAKAGDKCVFTGTLIAIPDIAQMKISGVSVESRRDVTTRSQGQFGNEGVTGLRALGVRDLNYKLSFMSCMVQPAQSRSGAMNMRGDDNGEEAQQALLHQLSQEEIDELRKMVNMEKAIYGKLVNSIAPTVFGHDTVKKGILLQLMGGVHKVTPEGINLRGDINVCIVGDPSTSKSQFLKYVVGFLPRSVYTSGKASSAAGLTASVIKDEETGEFSIEAGALMLADNGICAIDEFDKMDIKDQVAIHEAMEQQTISIAKAGIQATLNARTSILAAANPVGGRYNKKMTLKQNVNMSAPIMSRFDLFFVVLDECNEITDYNIARHIVNVHRLRDSFIEPEFSTEQLQRYIRYARTFKPKLTPAAAKKLAEYYRNLRQEDSQGVGKNSYRITVRQLESMIRLSEAIARAYCQEEILESYVTEAYNLLQKSIIRVEQDDVELEELDVLNEVMSRAEALAVSSPGGMEVDNDIDVSEAHANNRHVNGNSTKERIKIEYERFAQIQNMVVMKLKEMQESNSQDNGMKRNDLITWYLEQKEDEIESEEDLEREKTIIDKVLKYLVRMEEMLVEIRSRDYIPQPDDDATDLEDITIALHPNCVIADL